MVIFTGPEGDNFCFVKSNNVTNKSVNTKKAMTVAAITPVILAAKNIYLIFYSETTNGVVSISFSMAGSVFV